MLFLCFFFACYGVASGGHFSAPATTSTPVSACQTVFRGSGSKKIRTHTRAELRIRAPKESQSDGALLLPQRRRRKIFFLFALATLFADLWLLDWIFQKRLDRGRYTRTLSSSGMGNDAKIPKKLLSTTNCTGKEFFLPKTRLKTELQKSYIFVLLAVPHTKAIYNLATTIRYYSPG